MSVSVFGDSSTRVRLIWLLQAKVKASLLGHWKRDKIKNSLIKLFNLSAIKELQQRQQQQQVSFVLWRRLAQIAQTTSDGLHFDVKTLKASNQESYKNNNIFFCIFSLHFTYTFITSEVWLHPWLYLNLKKLA